MVAAALILNLRISAMTKRLRVSCSLHWGRRRGGRDSNPRDPPDVRVWVRIPPSPPTSRRSTAYSQREGFEPSQPNVKDPYP